MPRSFDVCVQSPTTVTQVHGAFGDENYWQDRFAAFGTATTLDGLEVDDDDAVTVRTSQDLRHDGLPRLIAKFYPGDLLISSTETWTPVGDGSVRGTVTIEVAGAPGSGHGAALLRPRGEGSELSFTGTVEFRVPLVGGRIESYLGIQFTEHIPDIQRFTTDWIAAHG
jgi:hypothetical protein